MMLEDKNKTENSSPLEESNFQEHGNWIDVNGLELARYRHIDAEEALKTLEIGLGSIAQKAGKKEVAKYVSILFKSLVSEDHLNRLETILNKMGTDTEDTTIQEPSFLDDLIKEYIQNHLQKMKPFFKCLPRIINTLNPLLKYPNKHDEKSP